MPVSKGDLTRIQGMYAQAIFEYRHPEGHRFRQGQSADYYRGMIDSTATILQQIDPAGTYQHSDEITPYLVGQPIKIKVPSCSAPVDAVDVEGKVYTDRISQIHLRYRGEKYVEILVGDRVRRLKEVTGGYERR